ncbi:putative zinc-binding metallopeptidase [Pseudomonas sp. NPDC007930]|uniref:zinc-binding metallopeptidase family protein n=1 Tax=Pseudomonas sp. NPDC007930 TaxID=3364417 RepID=UPI0036E7B143
MPGSFKSLSSRLVREPAAAPAPSRRWACRCGQAIFFVNSRCLACEAALGYIPSEGIVSSLSGPDANHCWQGDASAGAKLYRRCANLDTPAACNWLVPAGDPNPLCQACRLNHTIPDLSVPENSGYWLKVETAKRRMVAQLVGLGLAVIPKAEDEPNGLSFDFIGTDTAGNAPTTGHANGLITLDIKEADDAHREQVRKNLREPYRTLLGHFRHEVGHYYWDRLIAGSTWLEPFRALFGNEQASYADALEQHYQHGAPADWAEHYVSAYATMHPWEDWAETWAHYLHMMDAVDTALGFGMSGHDTGLDYVSYPLSTLYAPEHETGPAFLTFINAWIELAGMLNELSRAMGQPDFYPFVLPPAVVAKLHFIHLVVQQAGGRADEIIEEAEAVAQADQA